MADKPKKLTPEQAKAIYEANPRMSLVDLALQCGISKNTAYRWRDNDWKDLRSVSKKERRRIKANKGAHARLIEDTAKKATIQIKQTRLSEAFALAGQLPDDGLIREANRQVFVTCVAVLKEIAHQGVTLVKDSPQQLASLIGTLATAVQGSTKTWEDVQRALVKAGLPQDMVAGMTQPQAEDSIEPLEHDAALDGIDALMEHIKH